MSSRNQVELCVERMLLKHSQCIPLYSGDSAVVTVSMVTSAMKNHFVKNVARSFTSKTAITVVELNHAFAEWLQSSGMYYFENHILPRIKNHPQH